MTEEIHVYCMPGMAANSKIFEHLRLPKHFKIHLLDWIAPTKNESLLSYVSRLSENVLHKEPVLLGVSFGGIIVQEMSKIISAKKVVIISSVKSHKEFPIHITLGRKSRAYKFFPTQWVNKTEDFISFAFGPRMKKRMKLHKYYLSVRDQKYLDWALHHFFQWDREEADPNVIHIHGSIDALIPVFHIKNYISVPGGTHALILQKATWLNKHLPEIISS
jgi:hypothetical protein